jgi:hypothetical protein
VRGGQRRLGDAARGTTPTCPRPQPRPQVAAFTEAQTSSLRESLRALLDAAPSLAAARPAVLRSEARRLGDEVLELERYVQLNQVRPLDGAAQAGSPPLAPPQHAK